MATAQRHQDLSQAALQLGPLTLPPSGDEGDWWTIDTEDIASVTKGAEGNSRQLPRVTRGMLTINAQPGFPAAKMIHNLIATWRASGTRIPLAGAGISSAGEAVAWAKATPIANPTIKATGGDPGLQTFTFELEGVAHAPRV